MHEEPGAAVSAEDIRFPAAVDACVGAVTARGAPVFAVGGAVRDTLLGGEIDDWDFATRLRPAALVEVLAGFGRPDPVSELGRVAVRVDGFDIVFTTFRVEHGYGADRRPSEVRFVDDPVEDARRRDFTVNAIYVDACSRIVVDPFDGLQDLRGRRLRVIGDPRTRLAEDPLRVLRAVRFEASRGLAPTSSTAAAMAECAPLCRRLSPERRLGEVGRALTEPNAARAVMRLLDIGAIGHVVPELTGAEPRLRTETIPLLEHLAGGDPAAGWAALLGRPEVAETALGELRASRALRREVAARLALVPRLDGWLRLPRRARQRLLHACPARAHAFALTWAAAVGGEELRRALGEDVERTVAAGRLPMPSGADVLALGLAPGPEVGAVLEAVRDRIDAEDLVDPGEIQSALRAEVARRIKGRGPSDR